MSRVIEEQLLIAEKAKEMNKRLAKAYRHPLPIVPKNTPERPEIWRRISVLEIALHHLATLVGTRGDSAIDTVGPHLQATEVVLIRALEAQAEHNKI